MDNSGHGGGEKITGTELRAFVSHINQPELFDVWFNKTEAPAGINAANLDTIIQKGVFELLAFVVGALLSVIFPGSGITENKQAVAGVV